MLTNPVPLRTTAQLSFFDSPASLPRVYGRVTLSPIKYRKDGRQWLLADHAIQGVDSVKWAGKAYQSWDAVNWKDDNGHSIALLETFDTIEPEDLTVTVRGLTASDGSLVQNPADIVYDVLAFSGVSITRSQLDAFRTETQGMLLSGVVDGSEQTLRSQIDDILLSVGAVWSLGMPRIARLWPATLSSTEPYYLTLSALDIDSVESEADSAELVTALRVKYAYDHYQGEFTKSLLLEAPLQIRKYGRVERELEFNWTSDDRQAVAVAKRYLQYWSRPVWRSTLTLSSEAATETPPGVVVSVSHPYLPTTGALLTVGASVDILAGQTTIETEAAYGSAPTVTLVQTSEQFADIEQTLFSEFQNDVATIQALSSSTGLPLPGATVTLNGITRTADSNGVATFNIAPGVYQLRIEASGEDTIEIANYPVGVTA